MAAADDKKGFSLSRWSQRKLAAAREAPSSSPPKATAPATPAPAAPAAAAVPVAAGDTGAEKVAAPALPPVESLTFESDFTAFLGPKVDEALRRRALRTLFRDPRFNVMDGLDVYIDDYSKFEPLAPELVKELAHARYIFSPPPTRVNEQGIVEDIPEHELAAEKSDAEAAAQPIPETLRDEPALAGTTEAPSSSNEGVPVATRPADGRDDHNQANETGDSPVAS